MRKLLAGACCALFALSLVACGSSASSSAPSSSSSAPSSAAESLPAPDAGSSSASASSAAQPESASASGEESVPIPRTIGEDGAVVFGGLHFQVDPSFPIEEKDGSLTIVYSERESFVTISAAEGMELEEDSALKGILPALMLQSYLSAFDQVSSQQDADLTVAGVPAKGATFIGTKNSADLNCFAISFEDHSYTYLVAFMEAFPEESHISDLQALLDSMSLDA